MDNNVKRAIDTSLHALHVSAPQKERLLSDILEGKKMKKKTTFTVCVALVMLFALSGVALAAGLNLFDYFSKNDARLGRIAPQTALEHQSPITVSTVTLGTTTAAITNAYYDGQSLLVAYSIENGTQMERFTPADEQLARMTRTDTPVLWAAETDEEAALLSQYDAAVKAGTSFGLARYAVSPSDHTYTDDGIDLPPCTETQDNIYFLREYETPLPADAQSRDRLTLSIALYQEISYLWFDGRDFYTLYERSDDAGSMTVTVWNAAAPTATYVADGAYNGVPIQLQATVSAVHASITVTAQEEVFVALPADNWYEACVYDEAGNRLRISECGAADARTLTLSCEGTGALPESLTVYILTAQEGAWDRAAAMAQTQPYVLSRIDETR